MLSEVPHQQLRVNAAQGFFVDTIEPTPISLDQTPIEGCRLNSLLCPHQLLTPPFLSLGFQKEGPDQLIGFHTMDCRLWWLGVENGELWGQVLEPRPVCLLER